MFYTISLVVQLSKCRLATIRYISVSVEHFMSTQIRLEKGQFLTEKNISHDYNRMVWG